VRTSSKPAQGLRSGGQGFRSDDPPDGLVPRFERQYGPGLRCLIEKSVWEAMMKKLIWLLAFACLPTIAIAQNPQGSGQRQAI
jgi:hypothetical protein